MPRLPEFPYPRACGQPHELPGPGPLHEGLGLFLAHAQVPHCGHEPQHLTLAHRAGGVHDKGPLASPALDDPLGLELTVGLGHRVDGDVEVGGHIDTREPGPIRVHATVEALADDPVGGRTALLRTGGLRFIVTTKRNQYTMFSQFALLGVDITTADVVVVKIGYLEPDLYNTQKGWLMALTPGGVDQDLVRLGHHRIDRPMFPFDRDMADPGLQAQVVEP